VAARKTLFKKYLQVSMSIVLISFLLLGTMLLFLFPSTGKTIKTSFCAGTPKAFPR